MCTDGNYAHVKMLSIIGHQRNVCKNHCIRLDRQDSATMKAEPSASWELTATINLLLTAEKATKNVTSLGGKKWMISKTITFLEHIRELRSQGSLTSKEERVPARRERANTTRFASAEHG